MSAVLDQVRFAFQPLVNLNTGGVVAMEVLARPASGHVYDLLRAAAEEDRLAETDVALAVRALLAAGEHDTLLPLHLNVLADTASLGVAAFEPLCRAVADQGRGPREITLDVGGVFAHLPRNRLLDGLAELREAGFRLSWDGVGEVDCPLNLLAEVAPELVKVDRFLVGGLPHDPARAALVEALLHFTQRTRAGLVAKGVEAEHQLTALRRMGVHLVQGSLLAPAARRPVERVSMATPVVEATDSGLPRAPVVMAGPRVTEFLHPAVALPVSATAEEVRQVLADRPTVTGVVLVDEEDRPLWTIDRNRFLLAVTGPYGHALHAKRGAERLADRPRAVGSAATAMEVLDAVARGEPDRRYDDVVVVDDAGRCLGVVRISDIVRGVAELKVEEAAALNPLTRLPGSDAVNRDVHRRIAAGEVFAACWLDVDGFKRVNDGAGFAAGDDLIRSIGRSLTDAAAPLRSVFVGHVGGDDFLVVADLDDLVPLATAVLDAPRSVAGMPISLSLATLVCAPGSVADHREVSRLLAPLKQQAKALLGSSWVLGRPGSPRVDVLRGAPAGAHSRSPAHAGPVGGVA
ncbi:EAL domain-containing protein [Streptoalloteichus tenebrarius]|uniref:EAL domain-containing protein n=1 Tax=Streptoalloteichus tenebrarius (strain ATCC 17920 / DSM 40477 / JCM 4838 / CBS 697.72 / NBRC 16177 / NCIMB 11028 / NRRL B-12390 / A12253. 1 / ISP 5477) TaxID=1933 RepID=UPI0020A4B8C3|nr:GGDEF domain-containing protein [Streptoalloteichus tenebrarius]BFF04195.1 GGDEF domain-containing protein [Streptoalloteichus tenebrarius]